MCESYTGTDNPLHFKSVNVAEFTCGFDNITENYPFGRQNCTMSFFITKNDNSLTNLTVGTLVDLGPATSGQFVISGWSMRTEVMENNNGKVITVHLGLRRNFLREDSNKITNQSLSSNFNIFSFMSGEFCLKPSPSIFMVIYLPLIVMNVLNQASVYLTTEDKYGKLKL